jgi:D-lactate dehydrogenase (cytochrome)
VFPICFATLDGRPRLEYAMTVDSAAPSVAPCGSPLLDELVQSLGPEAVLTDPDERAGLSQDIYRGLELPQAVVRPSTVEQLAAVVALAARHRAPVTVRGGGASYTLGYAPALPDGLLIDTSALTRIAVDVARRTVTAEAGATWKALDAAVGAHGLRLPFWGTFSGVRATVGGSVSQHAIAMGSGLHECSATPVVAIEIVDGRGELLRTNRPEGAFQRAYGPDLTGLFLGDCGTLGVKARITFRLMERPSHVAACCIGFPGFDSMAAAIADVAGRLLASDMLGLDPEIMKGFLGAMTPRTFVASARALWSTAPGPIAGIATMARAAMSLRDYRKSDMFVAHFTVEGWSVAEVQAKLATIRGIVGSRGVPLSDAAPLALHGNPFVPLTPVAPASGGRWLPVHGIFSFADVPAFHAAYEAWCAQHAAELREHDVKISRMFLPLGSTGVAYEPTFYWPDSRTVVQERLAPPEHLQRIAPQPAREATRAMVYRMRRELTDLMQRHGAQHLQLGKWYPYLSLQHAGARELLLSLKRQLDPHGILNPGALEFPSEAPRPLP